jgi:hypothetical protein
MIFLSTHWTGSYDSLNGLVQPLLEPVVPDMSPSASHQQRDGVGDSLHALFTSLINAVMLSCVSDEMIQKKIK